MKLGFYYHITAITKDGRICVPGFLGFFLDSLAGCVGHLTLFLHEAQGKDIEYCDYALQADNIEWINMGHKSPAWQRFLFGHTQLVQYKKIVAGCDAVLVRAPSPLAPAFYQVFGKSTHIVFLIVGDYLTGLPHLRLPLLRRWAIGIMSVRLDKMLKTAAAHCCTLVNSQQIFEVFRPYAKHLHLVRTTTLRSTDFYYREDTCRADVVNMLFVGRYDFAKGLHELMEATYQLIRQGRAIHLHLAGWEDSPDQPVTAWMEHWAATHGITTAVTNHGKKQSGEALNTLYRSADIFVIPSYHEGFPRVIWEALANSCPVIATRVGSIPYYLQDGIHALLIEPQNTTDLVDKINFLLDNPDINAVHSLHTDMI